MRLFALAIVLCSLVGLTAPAQTQDNTASANATALMPLQVWLRREAAEFVEPRYTAMVTAGKSKICFLVPIGYYLRGDPSSGTLTLANAEGNSSITFAILPPLSSDAPPFSADTCRDWVLRDYPGGKITQEFPAVASAGKGPGFDVQWKASGGFVQCKRVLYISSNTGLLKFTATASLNHFDSAKSVLTGLIQTFRYSADGVLKVPPLPNTI
jgi:hypothetical protein